MLQYLQAQETLTGNYAGEEGGISRPPSSPYLFIRRLVSNYVPLHVHTHFSQMDGVATPEEYVERAVSIGMNAIAITDHGTLSGHRPVSCC